MRSWGGGGKDGHNYFVHLGISECLRAPSIFAKISYNTYTVEYFTIPIKIKSPVVHILYYYKGWDYWHYSSLVFQASPSHKRWVGLACTCNHNACAASNLLDRLCVWREEGGLINAWTSSPHKYGTMAQRNIASGWYIKFEIISILIYTPDTTLLVPW